ncbi:glycosyltransferase [Candidatus Pelagibacter sp.]|nr:glycosyltransferase [Candidatus Pelagibacter sp.]
MDLVSIIIPYYKKKKFISTTINSAISQSYENIEILIVYDDENYDDLKLLEEIKKKDERIRIIKNKKKLGAGLSRNKGISSSKGNYIAFLDADDTWEIDKLSKQMSFMTNNNYLVSHTSYQIVDEDRNVIGNRVARSFFHLEDLLKSCDIGTSTVIIKKDIFSEQIKFPSIKTKEDFVLWLRILERDIKIYGLDKNLSKWTKSNSSLSSSVIQKLMDGFKVYNKYMNFNSLKSLYYLICLSLNYIIKK